MKKKILVAPLNWGLGHASRCIPIINALIVNNFEPVVASDGEALKLLQKEFPKIKCYELPSYNIRYSKKDKLKYKLFLSIPRILRVIKNEKREIEEIIEKENLSGIISDNRFGVRNTKIPSVYITHQLNVLSGSTTSITSRIHQQIISKFNECWVPDTMSKSRLSGKLSEIKNKNIKVKFVGTLSRFYKTSVSNEYDFLIVLSGPEPQRSILEQILTIELKDYDKKVLLVRGVITDKAVPYINDTTKVVNYMLTVQLQRAFNESEIVLARSGYSTIMDIAKLEKKAFFIPTPGQFEQEYLAQRMDELNIAPFADQSSFKIKMLDRIAKYDGFSKTRNKNLNADLFNLF